MLIDWNPLTNRIIGLDGEYAVVPVEPTQNMLESARSLDALGCDVDDGDLPHVYGRAWQGYLAAARPQLAEAEPVATLVVKRRFLEWDCSAKTDSVGYIGAAAYAIDAVATKMPEGEYPLYALSKPPGVA